MCTVTKQLLFLKTYSKMAHPYIELVKDFIPKLTHDLHKGQCGRIGVIGGSFEYTGAPYFAAISSMKLGADLVHVFCCKDASTVIKSYSPELIVHPLLDEVNAVESIVPWLDRLHTLLIGPGLGREQNVLRTVKTLINICNNSKKPAMPLVIDADGLFLVTEDPSIVKDYLGAVILTPNEAEFKRLSDKLGTDDPCTLARDLGVVLVKKGQTDIIINGIDRGTLNLEEDYVKMVCDTQGSARRCGGQGDLLSGCITVFTAWYHIHTFIIKNIEFSLDDQSTDRDPIIVFSEKYVGFSLAAHSGCDVARRCSKLAFAKYGRSMTTSDMIEFIHYVFASQFE